MSNSEMRSAEEFPLLLPSDPDLLVTVLDGRDHVVYSATQNDDRELVLPRGLYTVRLERNRLIRERVVRLANRTDLSDFDVPRYSAAPLHDSALSHEYYSEPAARFSLGFTRKPLAAMESGRSASLLVFVRAVNVHQSFDANELTNGALALRNENGETVSEFSVHEVKTSNEYGWLALSAEAPPGFYRLVSLSKPRREVPLYLFAGFQTQAFILHKDRLLIEVMRVLMAESEAGFQPSSRIQSILDTALEGLMNRAAELTLSAENSLLNEKFTNPILGLIGAYTMFRRLRSLAKTQEVGQGDLYKVNIVLANLESLIPDSPDLQALQLWRNELQQVTAHSIHVKRPPIFRAGMAAIMQGALDGRVEIARRSLFERVTARQFADSPWVTWEALPKKVMSDWFAREYRQVIDQDTYSERIHVRRSVSPPVALKSADSILTERKRTLNWIQSAFFTALDRERNRLRRAGISGRAPELPDVELARQTGALPDTVRKEVAKLDRFSRDELAEVVRSQWPELATLLQESDRGMTSLSSLLTKVR